MFLPWGGATEVDGASHRMKGFSPLGPGMQKEGCFVSPLISSHLSLNPG